MKTEALFLLLILILGLFLCSFLGGNCEKESFTSTTTSTNLVTGTTYTDISGIVLQLFLVTTEDKVFN